MGEGGSERARQASKREYEVEKIYGRHDAHNLLVGWVGFAGVYVQEEELLEHLEMYRVWRRREAEQSAAAGKQEEARGGPAEGGAGTEGSGCKRARGGSVSWLVGQERKKQRRGSCEGVDGVHRNDMSEGSEVGSVSGHTCSSQSTISMTSGVYFGLGGIMELDPHGTG